MFAKAFWGEGDREGNSDWEWNYVVYRWEYHLQQMVMEENPIDYLRKFVEDE